MPCARSHWRGLDVGPLLPNDVGNPSIREQDHGPCACMRRVAALQAAWFGPVTFVWW